MAKNYVRDDVPLSRFGVLVAQLESIVASASQQPPDALLCFDLLSDLISAMDEEPIDSILLWQRKCEDALYSLLILGARRPVRHLASMSMAKIIHMGDNISVYSRTSSLQGFISDAKRSEPQQIAGVVQCLGQIYHLFGRKITSGLLETTLSAVKVMKFNEEFVRKETMCMLDKALEGSGGAATMPAYVEAFRLIMRSFVGDKSLIVRIAAARCLRTFASIGGPGLGVGELDNAASSCVKALEDPMSSVQDAFSEALGALIALGMNPDAQIQPRGKGNSVPLKKHESGFQRHLISPFIKATNTRSKNTRIGITLSWVFFLQAFHVQYKHPDVDLQDLSLEVMGMLGFDDSVDAHALACVLYILRVGIIDQMREPTQRSFLALLGKQLQLEGSTTSTKIAALWSSAYILKTLGDVPDDFKEILDNSIVDSLSHSSELVRIETALTLRTLAEVDPGCVAGLVSFGLTTLNALRQNVYFEKGTNLKVELDSLHGQAAVLAALMSIAPKLPLGYPARLSKSIFEMSKKMLMECGSDPFAAAVEKKAGWLLLASLLASTPMEELQDEVFDILSIWAYIFNGNFDQSDSEAFTSLVWLWSSAIEALTAFIKCFILPTSLNHGILLQPITVYLSRALSCLSLASENELPHWKHGMEVFTVWILMAYESLPDPMICKSDHALIIRLCSSPFRDPDRYQESSGLRRLLDRRDAWLGPWTPGRDWLEDELRGFEGGKDGITPCVWDSDHSIFPQPETSSKMLVNHMLFCFGILFSAQDEPGMMSLLGMIEECLKTCKKQPWRSACVTNICVGLLSGFKKLLSRSPLCLGLEILNSAQTIFLSILYEGDACASQHRASAEGLGLLVRLGSDSFTARMTKLLLEGLTRLTNSTCSGSIAFAIGCIHSSAGGMALSSLVPATVNLVSSLAKSSTGSAQIWLLHGLVLIIEAAGLAYISHVQDTLGLALELLLSEENGLLEFHQAIGQMINAIVAVLGPELSPGSIFFSRCKSVIAEISSAKGKATLLECTRFTQQLVLFAPHAVSVGTHVQTLLPTIFSRQPLLRCLSVSTLRHLIEKDPASVSNEKIEADLFRMLDDETDSDIGDLVRSTIMRWIYTSSPSCPFRWISVCRIMVLSLSAGMKDEINEETGHDLDQSEESETRIVSDNDNMVSSYGDSRKRENLLHPFRYNNRDLRLKTRIFAAECLSHVPTAVGNSPAHFDIILAKKQFNFGQKSGDWLVLHVQELISLAYQISTGKFERMKPIGLRLLTSVMDKFEMTQDPDLPGHLLLEQYQAQLVSAVRSVLHTSSGPILLEAGLELATKILTSGILREDESSVKRLFSLISHQIDDFGGIYYPSFSEWVSCKIKVRLLEAHASLKCYAFKSLKGPRSDAYMHLTPLFSKISSILGKYWISFLRDHCILCFRLHLRKNWKPFLEEICLPQVYIKLQPCFEKAWPVILQALPMDSVPSACDADRPEDSVSAVLTVANTLESGHIMGQLDLNEFQFIWGYAFLVLFYGLNSFLYEHVISMPSLTHGLGIGTPHEGVHNLYKIVSPVFIYLSTVRFFNVGFLAMDACQELIQVFLYSLHMENSWKGFAISFVSQIVQNCPASFIENESFSYTVMEVCTGYLFETIESLDAETAGMDVISPFFTVAKTLVVRLENEKRLRIVLPLLLLGYKCLEGAPTVNCVSKAHDFIESTITMLMPGENTGYLEDGGVIWLRWIAGTCLNTAANLVKKFIEGIRLVSNDKADTFKLLQMKLACSIEHTFSLTKLGHEMNCSLRYKEGEDAFFPFYKTGIKCMSVVLSDSDLKIQAIGLQVMRILLQKSRKSEGNCFLLFFVAEHLRIIFSIISKTLQEPSAESADLALDCFRILTLVQTLAKEGHCAKAMMRALLEAVVMVFSASEEQASLQAIRDVKKAAMGTVSHLAQIPSLGMHLRDVLVEMPSSRRQKLQGVILASISQEKCTQMKPPQSSATPLMIKVPLSKETMDIDCEPVMVDQEEEEMTTKDVNGGGSSDDDWDTFQSFSAETDTHIQHTESENGECLASSQV